MAATGSRSCRELLTLDKYKALSLEGRLVGYDFGGMSTLRSATSGDEPAAGNAAILR